MKPVFPRSNMLKASFIRAYSLVYYYGSNKHERKSSLNNNLWILFAIIIVPVYVM